MPSQKNTEQVNQISTSLDDAVAVVFLNYQGLENRKLEELRNSLEETDAQLQVTKNTLLKIGLRKSKHAVVGTLPETFSQTTATLYIKNDFLSPLKMLTQFIKQNNLPSIKGGIIDARYYLGSEITKIAELPSYETLISQLIGQIQAPIYGLAMVFAGNLRNLVYVLSQIEKSKGGESNG